MKDIFNTIELPKVGSNVFDLSHDWRTIFGIGELCPCLTQEVLPGDKWSMSAELMISAMPLVSAVPIKAEVGIHYFFCPYRLIWPEWEDWITGESSSDVPYFDDTAISTYQGYNLDSYLGLYFKDNAPDTDQKFSAFPFATYTRIITDYYLDENIQSETINPYSIWDTIELDAGENPQANKWTGSLIHINYRHDYFTSCLPFAQKGDAVTIPVFDSDEVTLTFDQSDTAGMRVWNITEGNWDPNESSTTLFGTDANSFLTNSSDDDLEALMIGGTNYLDVPSTASTISTLRAAYRLQEFLERDARGGTRYIENIYAHFGVRSSDGRLNRSEFIGGSKTWMNISEIVSNTLSVDSSSNEYPIGETAGRGQAITASETFYYEAEEHGLIMAMLFVRPEPIWFQGIEKKWTRFDRLDYYWPSFAHIGEQEVLKQEVYFSGSIATDEATFGYIPRYAEYKYQKNMAVGMIWESGYETYLPGRVYASAPSLNYQFIWLDPGDYEDIFAYSSIGDHEQLFAWVFHNIKAVRKMPFFANPSM